MNALSGAPTVVGATMAMIVSLLAITSNEANAGSYSYCDAHGQMPEADDISNARDQGGYKLLVSYRRGNGYGRGKVASLRERDPEPPVGTGVQGAGPEAHPRLPPRTA